MLATRSSFALFCHINKLIRTLTGKASNEELGTQVLTNNLSPSTMALTFGHNLSANLMMIGDFYQNV